ncbi:hypothetical protein PoMZ_04829 [Pyricularia oryzae]|uniref:Uncharacterized protein n=1 Tax=Pyricularia oryzae TaxID=318829 RepID=A0A4P7NE14_PYROR|nr:hypothetical protein PoMZ_04829 [Pyricularia oryzae]
MFTFFRAELSRPRISKTCMPWGQRKFQHSPGSTLRVPPPAPTHGDGVYPVCKPKSKCEPAQSAKARPAWRERCTSSGLGLREGLEGLEGLDCSLAALSILSFLVQQQVGKILQSCISTVLGACLT